MEDGKDVSQDSICTTRDLTVVSIPNPFERLNRKVLTVPFNGKSLKEYAELYFPADVDFNISINGHVVPKEHWDIAIPNPGDCILFIPVIGSRGLQIVAGILMIVVAAVLTYFAPYLSPAWANLAYAGAAMIAGAGLGMILSALMTPPQEPPNNDPENSQAYGWNSSTKQQPGSVISSCYGRNKLFGNIISAYIDNVNDKQYLHIMIHFGYGLFEELESDSIKINDRPHSDFGNIEIHYRPGYCDQSLIPGFNETIIYSPLNQKITNAGGSVTYTTTSNDFDGLEICINFPSGLYQMKDTGVYKSVAVEYQIEVQKVGSSEWTQVVRRYNSNIPGDAIPDYSMWDVSSGHWSLGKFYTWVNTTGWWEDDTTTLAYGGYSGKPSGVYEGKQQKGFDNQLYTWHYLNPGTHYITPSTKNMTYGYYHDWWEVDPATFSPMFMREILFKQTSYCNTLDYTTVVNGTTTGFTVKHRIYFDAADRDQYRIRITRLTEDHDSLKYASQTWLSAVNEIHCKNFTYPRGVLVGLKALATDKLSGSLRFSSIFKCKLVRVYRDSAWYIEYSKNPAWIAYDILTNPLFEDDLSDVHRYDGYDPAKLPIDKWLEFANWCDELVSDGGSQSCVTGWDGNKYICKKTHVSDEYNQPPYGSGLECESTTDSDPFGEVEIYDVSQTEKITDSNAWRLFNSSADAWELAKKACVIKYTFQKRTGIYSFGMRFSDYSKSPAAFKLFGNDNQTATYKMLLDVNNVSQTLGEMKWYDLTDYKTMPFDSYTLLISSNRGASSIQIDRLAFKYCGEYETWSDFWELGGTVSEGSPVVGKRYYSGTEKRFEFSGVFDTTTSAWEAALEVCQQGRATLVHKGTLIYPIIDKAQATPVQLFSIGNIKIDSFRQRYIPYIDRSAEIEINFKNEENDYDDDHISVIDTSINEKVSPATLQYRGLTRKTEAWRQIKYRLAYNKYLKQTAEIEVSVDAIAASLFDRVSVQHDVPKWGIAGGRIVNATTNTVTLDCEVEIESGKTYAIMIRLNADDTIFTKTISAAMTPGIYSTLTISVPFTTIPSKHDIYAFGESTLVVKDFRISGYKRTSDLALSLQLVEYCADIYAADSGTPEIPDDTDYTKLVTTVDIKNVSLKELKAYNSDGSVRRSIMVSYSVALASQQVFAGVEVWYEESTKIWQTLPKTTNCPVYIENAKPLTYYTVVILGITSLGVKQDISKATKYNIYTSADTNSEITATDVTPTLLEIFGQGNDTVFTGKDCVFSWAQASTIMAIDETGNNENAGTLSPDNWFMDYKVEILNSAGTLLRTDYVASETFTYTLEMNKEDNDGTAIDTFTIKVYIRDRYGNQSAVPATLTVSNDPPADIANLAAYQLPNGIQFTWDKNTEVDLYGYRYRTKIVGGSWGAWTDTENNNVSRVLTASEISTYTNKPQITIEIYVKDVFGNLSENVQTITGYAGQIVDNIFQLFPDSNGTTGTLSSLYDSNLSSGGVNIA